jgi:hypothetical protein
MLENDVAVNIDDANRYRDLGLSGLRLDALSDRLGVCEQVHDVSFQLF